MIKTYDQSCHDLATLFLSDEPDLNTATNIHILATEIQQCIENEISHMWLQHQEQRSKS